MSNKVSQHNTESNQNESNSCLKRRLNINDSNNNKKRRKLNNNNVSENANNNSNNSKEENKDELETNDLNIQYNAETTVELANRLHVPTYAHKVVFHTVKWTPYLNTKYDTTKHIQLEGIEASKDAFILKNVLSKNECETLIHLSESHGYCPLFSALNGKTNRTNTRMIIDDESLSLLFYERIKCYLPNVYKINGQIWELVGLNPRFRFCKYMATQQFKMHHDGRNGIKGECIASFYTINIYLNDANKDFEGGNTTFYEYNTKYNRKRDMKHMKYKESSKVIPETGLFLIFNHYPNHYKHCGEIIKKGTKYIARTEAMYKLIYGKNNWKHRTQSKSSHK